MAEPILRKFRYDPRYKGDYPRYRCPKCRIVSGGVDEAVHAANCTRTGYDGCIVIFGPKQAALINGNKLNHIIESWFHGVTLAALREKLAEIFPA